ncbi:hypothetical protein QBC38DRAFT_481997 [Podospora fimiseda]|uniref:NAD dependent epimerase/dehydratase n=1 Tax=Podospora fimiseda TaxID=252190 RepID=A0AAN7BMM7_9PEZI|nr:hypothetical protein QBC38DRAFT_481997 [Podospora fimiseda]
MSKTTSSKPLSSLPPLSSLLPSINFPLSSPIWTLLEKLYSLPPSPPPLARKNPMQVLCVGLPRSGTESLQQALLILGYDYTYHGWDIVYPSPSSTSQTPHPDAQLWSSLARKKFFSPSSPLTTTDFDSILSTSQAVTDAPCSLFASEIISAYPKAKVILNQRHDETAWQKSLVNTLVKANESWSFWLASWFDRECFWAWHVYERFLWPALFRVGPGETLRDGVEKRAEMVSREHCAMIRGLVPKERLLEWYIEDGWEPLCKFLGKPVPDVPFPHANAATGGWKAREEQCNKRWVEKAFLRLITGMNLLGLLVFVVVCKL